MGNEQRRYQHIADKSKGDREGRAVMYHIQLHWCQECTTSNFLQLVSPWLHSATLLLGG